MNPNKTANSEIIPIDTAGIFTPKSKSCSLTFRLRAKTPRPIPITIPSAANIYLTNLATMFSPPYIFIDAQKGGLGNHFFYHSHGIHKFDVLDHLDLTG